MALMGGRSTPAVYGHQDLGTIEALLASASDPVGFHASRSMMCFEDYNVAASMATIRPFSHRSEIDDMGEDDQDDYGLHQLEKKRRLSINQVQFLEKSFEVENKLEPERKLQLARDLGLQPRQVAIWFQNRRARWKTKQLEKDFEVLQSSFNALKSDYDDMVKEKERLKAEVQSLTERLLFKENANDHHTSPLHLPPFSPPFSPLPCKHEDMYSANSTALSSRIDAADSTNMPELDNSDLSQPEDDEGEKALNDGGYGFEEPSLWFWPYN